METEGARDKRVAVTSRALAGARSGMSRWLREGARARAARQGRPPSSRAGPCALAAEKQKNKESGAW